MSDDGLRELERAYRSSGSDADADAYLLGLERAGDELAARQVRGRWGQRARVYSEAEILGQLDAEAERYAFPMLDNGYVYLGATRLRAWRDLERWALILEVVGYSPRAGCFDDALFVFGNCLAEGRAPGSNKQDFLYPVGDGPSGPHQGEDDFFEALHPEARDLRIRDQVVEVSRDPAFYAAREVELAEPPRVGLEELLRALVVDHRQLLFASDDELAARLAPAPPELLRLDEWRHPNLADGELPSQCEAFQQLAQALVAGDPDLYRPTHPPNTHWSNWPEGGAL